MVMIMILITVIILRHIRHRAGSLVIPPYLLASFKPFYVHIYTLKNNDDDDDHDDHDDGNNSTN